MRHKIRTDSYPLADEMNKTDYKRVLIINRQPPYGRSTAREALDICLSMGAFEQAPSLLFLGDGVTQLLKGQDSEGIEQKNQAKSYPVLELYDITAVYVDQQSLEKRSLSVEDLVIPAELVSQKQVQDLMLQHDIQLAF